MDNFKNWLITADLATLVLGSVLVYFSEEIVLLMFPTEPMPTSVVALLYYVLIFSIAAYWIFNGFAYATVKIFWNFLYNYIEKDFREDFKNLSGWQKIKLCSLFYLGLFSLLVLTFLSAVRIFTA